jgi:hypothetical protein
MSGFNRLFLSVVFGWLVAVSHADARITCSKIKTCDEACSYYLNGERRLDRDHDGIPCEKLCHEKCDKDKKPETKKQNRRSDR